MEAFLGRRQLFRLQVSEGVSRVNKWERSGPGRRPETGACPTHITNGKETSVVGAEGLGREEKGATYKVHSGPNCWVLQEG